MPAITKLLVANRSEIAIRVFRSATELGIPTVAIYAHEDRYALHRFKADEAYQIGTSGEPIKSYLSIDAIIAVAQKAKANAIHPGYGFLSEKPEFAQACAKAGILFVGPTVDQLQRLGDKTAARKIAAQANVPILSGTESAIQDANEGYAAACQLGFPVILKAAHGGGGRGMRVVESEDQFIANYETARRESLAAFGSPDIFLERFIRRARHIEVQLLGDQHGNLVHLYERDCSVQRRHQKVVEIAPAPNLDPQVRDALCQAAVKIGQQVDFGRVLENGKRACYENAGTVEFLLDADSNQFFFIEVNPRIQVEHTVTEEVTGFDIVKSQLLVAQGFPLSDPRIGIEKQADITTTGFAIQCRVTTEDPENNFTPDYGKIAHYRSAGGMGIRLDAGSAFSGAVVTPYYDSLMVKVSARGRRFVDAISKMQRCLAEFRVRGVKTNIPFLTNLLAHSTFVEGTCTTRFIDETPKLREIPKRRDRATKVLSYLGDVIVNKNSLVKGRPVAIRHTPAPVPKSDRPVDSKVPLPTGARQVFLDQGAKGLSQWVLEQKQLLITDTTFRDAHQSLLATRFRTFDLLQIAPIYAEKLPQLFSLEMWGGATFDTSMRFLKECPWDRLTEMRKACPNILFQMLLRASNAVGYTNYPDNVVREFVKEARECGIDVFRVFDCLNWVKNMEVAIDAVCEAGGICEAAICYTGDITNTARKKYDIDYYVKLAKDLEKRGAHILAIKDMAGLCKPEAAAKLVERLKKEIGIPIHFHTHDTNGIQAASYLRAADAGVNIVDCAMAPLSGGTSQPNLNTLCESLRFQPRSTGLDTKTLDEVAEYWRSVRQYYTAFESVPLAGTADLYNHEMPGGQYTNLFEQARSLGLEDRWSEVCRLYAEVNQMFGDIVKVTPTSKSVGDMALFMVANNLTSEEVLHGSRELSFPEGVIDLISGAMGQPPGEEGFPALVKKRILGDRKPFTGRPGEVLPPDDLTSARKRTLELLDGEPLGEQDLKRQTLSYLLYGKVNVGLDDQGLPVYRDGKVYEAYAAHRRKYSDTSGLPTPNFFYGMQPGDEITIDIEVGKTLFIKYISLSEPHPDGTRTVSFELNGQPRDVTITDASAAPQQAARAKADPDDPAEIGATMPGMVVLVPFKSGEQVSKGQKLLTLEAMKMETSIYADRDGIVRDVRVKPGDAVETGDLLLTLEFRAD